MQREPIETIVGGKCSESDCQAPWITVQLAIRPGQVASVRHDALRTATGLSAPDPDRPQWSEAARRSLVVVPKTHSNPLL